MAGGWLTKFWSTFFKSPFIMRYKMRRQSRKIFHILKHMRKLIYETIPEKVLKAHRITSAMRDDVTVGKEAKKAVNAEFELAFDAEIEKTLTLKEIQEIEAALMKHEEQHGSIGFEREFGQKMERVLANAHGEDKDEYFGYLEPIIKVAEKSGNYNTLIAKIRELGPTQLQPLSALALRLEIRVASKGISKLRGNKKIIEAALRKWDLSKGDRQKQEMHIRQALNQVVIEAEADLHNEALITKRDFLLMLLTLQLLDTKIEYMTKFYHDHVMPRIPEEERIKNIEAVKLELAEHAHILAQGLRRIMSAEDSAAELAKKLTIVRKRAVA